MAQAEASSDLRLRSVIFENFLLEDFKEKLLQAAIMDPQIVPEWDEGVKLAYALDVQHRYSSVEIMIADAPVGPSFDFHWAVIKETKPDVVVSNFGIYGLCNVQYSPYHIASTVYEIGKDLVSEDMGVKYVALMGCICLAHQLPCSRRIFSRRVFGFNSQLKGSCINHPLIKYKPIASFWKDTEDQKIDPLMYDTIDSFFGLDPASAWVDKYCKHFRLALLDSYMEQWGVYFPQPLAAQG